MYSSPYFVPFSCQMVVMKGLTYHMIGHCNKLHYIWSFFTPEVYKLYQYAMPFTVESKNLILIIQNLQFLETKLLYCVTKHGCVK